MPEALWTAVDEYITQMLVPPDPVLDTALESSNAAGLPVIQVTPNQGKLLHVLARLQGTRRILEIGTLGGYSTIWLARALPTDGRLITLETSEKYAEIARANIKRANLSEVVHVCTGMAIDSLQQMATENCEPFDLIFIDADKQNNPAYFEWALKLSRCGSLIIGDNVVRDGEVVNGLSEDARVQGIRRF